MRTLFLCGLLMMCGKPNWLSAQNKKFDNHTVSKFDINRYMGKWYEIARLDHVFERGMVGCTAEYELMDDGCIKVINQGYKGTKEGKLSRIEGVATPTKDGTPGKLRVKFFMLFSSDYMVLELDQKDYSYALVGSRTSDYLWILSRTPTMPYTDLKILLERAHKRGYDTSQLIYVDQR